MSHPTPEDVDTVVATLEAAIAAYSQHALNMDYSYIYINEPCGTVACHGGWYTVGDRLVHDLPITPETYRLANGLTKIPLTYGEGAYAMARDLGFQDGDKMEDSAINRLTRWAHENPDIWGNASGRLMFDSNRAFLPGSAVNTDDPPDVTIEDVIEHWRGVARRLRALPEDQR